MNSSSPHSDSDNVVDLAKFRLKKKSHGGARSKQSIENPVIIPIPILKKNDFLVRLQSIRSKLDELSKSLVLLRKKLLNNP